MLHVVFGRQYTEKADAVSGWRRAQFSGPQTRLKSGGADHSREACRGGWFCSQPSARKMTFVGGHDER
jgi:hypothetical protein